MDERAEEVAAAAAWAGGDGGWAIVMAAEVQDVDWQKLETEWMGYGWMGYGQGGWKWVTEQLKNSQEMPPGREKKGEWNSIIFEEPLVLSPVEGEFGEETGADPKTEGLVSFGKGCCKEEGTLCQKPLRARRNRHPGDHQHPLFQG